MEKPTSKEDAELFRKSVGNVSPITHNRVLLKRSSVTSKQKNTAITTKKESIEFPVQKNRNSNIGPNDILQFKRTGLQNRVVKRLRTGQIPVIAELDLHGQTIINAKLILDNFLQNYHKDYNKGCLRIIHGKGYRSQYATPVIKQHIPNWLQDNCNVLAYCSCPVYDGGTGAIYVLMKKG